jgi:hypothetical protein
VLPRGRLYIKTPFFNSSREFHASLVNAASSELESLPSALVRVPVCNYDRMASKEFLCTVHAMKPSASLETWQGVAEEARRQQSKVRVPWRTGLGSGGKDIPTPSSRCLTLVCSVFPSSILPKPAPSFHPIFKSIWKPKRDLSLAHVVLFWSSDWINRV